MPDGFIVDCNCLSTCISIVLLGLLLHFRSLCLNPHFRWSPFLVAYQILSTPSHRLSCLLIDLRSCITSPPFHLLLTLDLCPSILSSPGVSPVSLFLTLLCYKPALSNSSKIYCRTSWLSPRSFRIRKFHYLCYTSRTLSGINDFTVKMFLGWFFLSSMNLLLSLAMSKFR